MFKRKLLVFLKQLPRKTGRFASSAFKYGCMSYVFFDLVGGVYITNGTSMEPTIKCGNILLCSRLVTDYEYGDIVISKSVTKPWAGNICKRIVGSPGDYVFGSNGLTKVPDGHVWLEGDNKMNSLDSRSYGPVPVGLLLGRVYFRIWPLWELTYFSLEKFEQDRRNMTTCMDEV